MVDLNRANAGGRLQTSLPVFQPFDNRFGQKEKRAAIEPKNPLTADLKPELMIKKQLGEDLTSKRAMDIVEKNLEAAENKRFSNPAQMSMRQMMRIDPRVDTNMTGLQMMRIDPRVDTNMTGLHIPKDKIVH